jgi:hypothetical protein
MMLVSWGHGVLAWKRTFRDLVCVESGNHSSWTISSQLVCQKLLQIVLKEFQKKNKYVK